MFKDKTAKQEAKAKKEEDEKKKKEEEERKKRLKENPDKKTGMFSWMGVGPTEQELFDKQQDEIRGEEMAKIKVVTDARKNRVRPPLPYRLNVH
jgi:hypothetical protein